MDIVKKFRPDRFLYVVWLATSVLWGGVALQPLPSRAEERMLSVVSSPTGLTVEAHGVGMEEVLREIGKQLGFAVTAKEAVYPTVDVSIKDAPPEEVLQQILRGENYALVYRNAKGESAGEKGEIGKVLLLSPSGVVAANPPAKSEKLEQERRQALSQNQAAATSSPETAQTASVFGQDGWARLREKADAISHGGPVTVDNILAGQAFQVLQAMNAMGTSSDQNQLSTGEGLDTADTEHSSEASDLANLGADEQRGAQKSFTEAIEVGQRHLAVLVEGLAAATRSVYNAQANQGQGDR